MPALPQQSSCSAGSTSSRPGIVASSRAGRVAHALRVQQVAGVLERDRQLERAAIGAGLVREQLRDVADRRREPRRALGVAGIVGEQVPVVAQVRAAAGRVGDDEIDARACSNTSMSRRARESPSSRRPAWTESAPQQACFRGATTS